MNATQLIILLLVVVGPGIAQVYQKIKEKQQIDRVNKQRERMKYEALRTGRSSQEQAPEMSAKQVGEEKMASLERDRQARLGALRDQARQRALAKQAQSSQIKAQQQPAANAGQVPRQVRRAPSQPVSSQRSPQRSVQRAQQSAQRTSKRRGQQGSPPPQPSRQRASKSPGVPVLRGLTESQKRHRKEEAVQAARMAEVRAQAAKVRATAEHVAIWLQDPAALKRAIVMHEVLGPPVSMR